MHLNTLSPSAPSPAASARGLRALALGALSLLLLSSPVLAADEEPCASCEAEATEDGEAMLLSLSRVVEESLDNNLQIRSARKDRDLAETAEDSARGAFDPIINLFYSHSDRTQPNLTSSKLLDVENDQDLGTTTDSWSGTWSQKLYYGARYEATLRGSRNESSNLFTSESGASSLGQSYSVDATLKYTQPLLRGFGRDSNRRAIEQAINSTEVANNSFKIRARDILKSTIDAYWNLYFAVEDLKVKRAACKLAQRQLVKNQIMVDVGTLAPLEVVQSCASVADRQRQIISAKAAVENARDTLRQLMGVPEDSPWWQARLLPAEKPSFQRSSVELEEVLEDALAVRLELKSADLRIANAELGLASSKDALQPQLDAALEISTAGLAGVQGFAPLTDLEGNMRGAVELDQDFTDAFHQVGHRTFNSWNASLTYSQNIFNKSAKAAWANNRIDLENQRIQLERARQDIIIEVRKAVRDLETTHEQLIAAKASMLLQERKLEAELKKFDNGLSTNFEVLQFTTDLTEAESSVQRAIIDHMLAQVAIKKARGTLLTEKGQLRP